MAIGQEGGGIMEESQGIAQLMENEDLLLKIVRAQKLGLDVEAYLDNFIEAKRKPPGPTQNIDPGA